MALLKLGKYISWISLALLAVALILLGGGYRIHLLPYNYKSAGFYAFFGLWVGALAFVLALIGRIGFQAQDTDQRSAITNAFFFSIVATIGNMVLWLFCKSLTDYLS